MIERVKTKLRNQKKIKNHFGYPIFKKCKVGSLYKMRQGWSLEMVSGEKMFELNEKTPFVFLGYDYKADEFNFLFDEKRAKALVLFFSKEGKVWNIEGFLSYETFTTTIPLWRAGHGFTYEDIWRDLKTNFGFPLEEINGIS